MQSARLILWLGAFALVGIFWGGFLVIRPFFLSLAWAFILALITWPIYSPIRRSLGNHRTRSALLMTIILGLFLAGGLIYVSISLATELQNSLPQLQSLIAKFAKNPPSWIQTFFTLPGIGKPMEELFHVFQVDATQLNQWIKAYGSQWLQNLAAVSGNIGQNIFNGVFTLFILFFFYRDGDSWIRQTEKMIERILKDRARPLMDSTITTIKTVFFGVILAAAVQGLMAGIGYWISGVYPPLLLGITTALSALIPFAGAPLIWFPAALWLFLNDQLAYGIFLIVWGMLVVGTVDNLVRFLVIGRGMKIPILLVVIGVIGGLFSFGLLGIFLGPVLISALIILWKEIVAHEVMPPG